MSQRIDKQSGRLVVVAFGDSTTATREGVTVYPDLLQQHWQDRQQPITVINAGVRGNYTEDALARIDKDVTALSPDIVIVRFGINDSAIDVWESPPATVARVPLIRFRHNMVTIVEMIRASGAMPLLCTPNPHHSNLLPPWQSLLLDGMHPNDEGHRLAARLLLPRLDALLAERI